MKTPFAWLLYVLGVTRFAAWWHRKDVVILNYHGIGAAEDDHTDPNLLDLSVSLESFHLQIAYLRRRHRVISLREFLSANASGTQLPDYSVVLTFDDGYRSFLEVAPILLNDGLPATLFLVTEMMRNGQAHTESSNHADRLSWTEVRTLDQHDIFDFGSHTCSHPSLPNLTPEDVDHELRVSLNEIRCHVKNVMPALAYPNGAYSGISVESVTAAGYTCGLTINPGPNKIGTSPYFLQRQTIRGKDDIQMFAARLSCLTHWLYGSRFLTSRFLSLIASWFKVGAASDKRVTRLPE